MKRTPANQDKGQQRSNTALASSEPYVIQLPYADMIRVKNGDTVQWSWKHPFSVTVNNNVVSPSQAQAAKSGDQYITAPVTVVGQPSTHGQCVYTSGPSARPGPDNNSAHLRGTVNPPPPPPPNQIIVDNA